MVLKEGLTPLLDTPKRGKILLIMQASPLFNSPLNYRQYRL
jgi:hypothetical protein